MSKIPVSVIIAAKNEERALPTCLSALHDFDEIIVVDSNSTDRTIELAGNAGATVLPFQWNGLYPKKRQWCLDHVPTRHDWIFFVDADEVLTPQLVDEIRHLPFDCAGYFVRGRYIWRGKTLRHGLKNNKLALFDRKKFEFPVVDDLAIPGMGEMEGHYQPVLRDSCHGMIGQLRCELDHNAEPEWLARHLRYAAWERGMNTQNSWPVDPVRWRQILKKTFRKLPARGMIAFLHSYIFKCGVLDGRAGFDFARKRAAYYRMITD